MGAAPEGIDEEQLITTGSGFSYFPDRISRRQLTLLGRPPEEPVPAIGLKSNNRKLRTR
jgi:hypothetical protein